MSDPFGFGLHPWGVSPAGYGTPGSEASFRPALYLDNAGNPTDARAIDPATGDLILRDGGQPVGAHSVEGMVYLAIQTARGSSARGSSALADFGRRPWPPTKTEATKNQVREIIREALSDLVQQRYVRIDHIEVKDRGRSGISAVLDWTDLTRQTQASTTINPL